MQCFDCGGVAAVDHHVVPESLGGTATVPLCNACHSLVHDAKLISHGRLTSLGLARSDKWVGLVPYGFELATGGRLVENADELARIQKIKRWHRRGVSYRRIADRLNGQGVRSRRGQWGDSSVRALVKDHLSSRKARYGAGRRGIGADPRPQGGCAPADTR